MDREDSVLRIRGAPFRVSLQRGDCLRGTQLSPPAAGLSFCLPLAEIVSVKPGKGRVPAEEPKDAQDGSQFTVFYVKRERRQRWRLDSLLCEAQDPARCREWMGRLQRALDRHGTTRPRSLLVFVNPFGGRRQAGHIYRSKVAALFHLAGIVTRVIETSSAFEARDHILQQDLQGVDGLVCVGGDGMFNEVLHGLISRTQREAGVSEHSPEASLVPPSLRIGIIPAGSTDCVCYSTVGTNDPVTSALHIIIGDSQPLDVCSVHQHDRLVKFSVSLLGYGFYGDVLADSAGRRWMGPLRYDYSGFKMVLGNRSYQGTVEFQKAEGTLSHPRDSTRCRAGCLVCAGSTKHPKRKDDEANRDSLPDPDSPTEGRWQSVEGSFVAVNLTCICSACPKSPEGLSPCAHLADGTADLVLVRRCSTVDFLRHLCRHTNRRDQFDLPFVSVHRVTALRFTPKVAEDWTEDQPILEPKSFFSGLCPGEPLWSSWSCDGESLPHAPLKAKVHHQLIRLFARGIESEKSTPLFSRG
ncbi:ceramide kinase-like isoform X1 [Tachyglossus aculeatus]|uniref:ceramide kinase-like isoform X1 n=1 Tax=Tachyglossus aculeatus TaxID=9261 RepID=UPI0018F60881|nr:ceramide kinase-like isoform X1 [Tachyglossus aculeatus]